MKIRRFYLATASMIGLLTSQLALGEVYFVTSNSETGQGSLRSAINAASQTEGPHTIVLKNDGKIEISEPLSYTGQSALAIYGRGQTISAAGNFNMVEATNGANLTINNLHLVGPGGFSIKNRGDLNGKQAGKGIFVKTRQDQSGVIHLVLNTVSVADVAGHGIHVSDCSLAETCGGGVGGEGEGSNASVMVKLNQVAVNQVGHGRFDGDGLRVDERGVGDIHAVIIDSSFTDVGADGVELDEGQDGSVWSEVSSTSFLKNGTYCEVALLKPFLPEKAEAEFDDQKVREAEIPGNVTGSPDDRCIEREVKLYDSGFVKEYEIAIDLDDGFDIDESGAGDLTAVVVSSKINSNLDEGLDLDELDQGDINVTIIDSVASGNTDEGYKFSEAGDGGVFAHVIKSKSVENGGKGFEFEEEDGGDLAVYIDSTQTAHNDDGDQTGVKVVQKGKGQGIFTSNDSEFKEGVKAKGVEVP